MKKCFLNIALSNYLRIFIWLDFIPLFMNDSTYSYTNISGIKSSKWLTLVFHKTKGSYMKWSSNLFNSFLTTKGIIVFNAKLSIFKNNRGLLHIDGSFFISDNTLFVSFSHPFIIFTIAELLSLPFLMIYLPNYTRIYNNRRISPYFFVNVLKDILYFILNLSYYFIFVKFFYIINTLTLLS